jgi:VCBS repeat-containing protein
LDAGATFALAPEGCALTIFKRALGRNEDILETAILGEETTMSKANHAAVIGKPTVHDVTEDATTPTLVATGTISISDSDPGQNAFQTSVIPAAGDWGTLVLAANGSYTYSVSNDLPQLQSLGAGDTKVDTFTITSLDGTTKQVSFTIHGVNDAAVIGDPTVHDVTEDASNPTLTATGMIPIQDPDQGQSSFKMVAQSAAGNLGILTIAKDGSYIYSVANSAVQYLGGGDTKIDTFTIKSFDGTSKSVSFTIHGTNDPAVIGTPIVHDVTEDVNVSSGNLTASGTLAVSDLDQGQASFQTGVTSAAGNLGTLTLAANGAYTYSVANSAVQYLSATDTKTDTFTVTSLDGTTKQVSFAIHGAQDAPNLDLGATTATGTSDANIALSIGASLIDTSSTLTVEIDGVPGFYSLNHGTALDDGRWLVSAADLSTLALVPNGATACNFNLHVTAISDDGVHQANSIGQDIAVTVSPGANEHGGRIVDGYIAGATVFADANNNGILDPGEAHTTTNADGSFTLVGGSGPLISMGGTDVSTGLAFDGVLKAPAGSTVITPLTTLIAALVPNNATQLQIDAASDQVAAALGLIPISICRRSIGCRV